MSLIFLYIRNDLHQDWEDTGISPTRKYRLAILRKILSNLILFLIIKNNRPTISLKNHTKSYEEKWLQEICRVQRIKIRKNFSFGCQNLEEI